MPSKTKVIIALAIVFILVCGLVIILRPLPFDESFDYISIGYMEPDISADGKPLIHTAEFSFSSQDTEVQQIKQILKKIHIPSQPYLVV